MKVHVYRNLHKDLWSVRRGGIVVDRVTEIVIAEATLKVSAAGRARVLKERRKNVHAYVVGEIVESAPATGKRVDVTYNPYLHGYFFRRDTGDPVPNCRYAILMSNGKMQVIL